MVVFIVNHDAKTIHLEPGEQCNIDEARKDGNVTEMSFAAAAMLRWEKGYRGCRHCLQKEEG